MYSVIAAYLVVTFKMPFVSDVFVYLNYAEYSSSLIPQWKVVYLVSSRS